MSAPTATFLNRIANRPLFSGLIVALLSLIAISILTLKTGLPQPRVQDEFSYLLAADTFSHGRLTSPTPQFSDHFQSPHVLMHPTYMSKYPPAQGIALALGQVATGLPIAGVWLTTTAASLTIYWMLLAFVPRPWSLAGGIIAALNPQLLAWSGVFWGGAVAVLGAALLIGAAVRWTKNPTSWNAILAAIALLILANSRPYEGFVLSAPIVIFALIAARRRPPTSSPSAGTPGKGRGGGRAPIALAITLAVGASMMAYYNYKITGNPLRLPTIEYSNQFDLYPKFWFLAKHPAPTYPNDTMRQVHTTWERGDYETLRTLPGFVTISTHRLWQLLKTNIQPIPLILPFAAGLCCLDAWIAITLIIFAAGILAESWFLPHYAAPILPRVILIIALGFKRLTANRVGRILAALSAASAFITIAIFIASPASPDSKRIGRQDLIAAYPQLQAGQHLIFVQYTADHLLDDEWVYNTSNIPTQKIIWAHTLNPASDRALKNAFPDRHAWLLTVGKDQLILSR
jgi:hypothetical protein